MTLHKKIVDTEITVVTVVTVGTLVLKWAKRNPQQQQEMFTKKSILRWKEYCDKDTKMYELNFVKINFVVKKFLLKQFVRTNFLQYIFTCNQTCKMSYSLHHPNFRQNKFTPKSALFLAILNFQQSRIVRKYCKIDSKSLKYPEYTLLIH